MAPRLGAIRGEGGGGPHRFWGAGALLDCYYRKQRCGVCPHTHTHTHTQCDGFPHRGLPLAYNVLCLLRATRDMKKALMRCGINLDLQWVDHTVGKPGQQEE